MESTGWLRLLSSLPEDKQHTLIISAHWQHMASKIQDPVELDALWSIYVKHLRLPSDLAEVSSLFQSRVAKPQDQVEEILNAKYGPSDLGPSDTDSDQ